MSAEREDDQGWATPNCEGCLRPLEPRGDVQEVETADGQWLEGAVWWQCPDCGLVRLA